MIVARHSRNRHAHCVVRALVVVIERCLTRTSDVSRRDIPRTNRLSAGVKVRFGGVTRAKSFVIPSAARNLLAGARRSIPRRFAPRDGKPRRSSILYSCPSTFH